MPQQFTRMELYDLVWQRPMRSVAETLGVSDVALAKRCKRANVPVPPRGYWARKKATQAASIPPLPPRFPGASENAGEDHAHHYWGSDWRERFLAAPIPAIPMFDEDVPSLTKRVRQIVGAVEFLNGFDVTHAIVKKLLAQDDRRRDEFRRYRSEFYAPKYDQGAGRRRLLILNSLFLALQRIGCSVSTSTSWYADHWPEKRQATVRVGSQNLTLAIEPFRIAKEANLARQDDERLTLTLSALSEPNDARTWDDKGGKRLDQKLTDIVVTMLVTAEMRYRRAAVARREWHIERRAEVERELYKIEADRIRAEEEALRQLQRKQVSQLIGQSIQLSRANQIRSYVASVREGDASVPREQLDKWAAWALSEANRIDPTKNGAVARDASRFASAS